MRLARLVLPLLAILIASPALANTIARSYSMMRAWLRESFASK
jgi:hypothetical protein